MKSTLFYESVDAFKTFLKSLYKSGGVDAVGEWVKEHLEKGATLHFAIMPSGRTDNEVVVCDRSMDLLNHDDNRESGKVLLSSLCPMPRTDECELYISLRILFIPEPFGITIYRKKETPKT